MRICFEYIYPSRFLTGVKIKRVTLHYQFVIIKSFSIMFYIGRKLIFKIMYD